MPSRDVHTSGPFEALCFFSIFLGILALPGFAWWPLAFVFPVIVVGMTLYGEWQDSREAKRRSGESICSFARSFDCRVIDTWIIRGVYEEFSWSYPIRADDSFAEDLGIVDEDFEEGVIAVAKRIGRSLEDAESNPMFDKLSTVRDLVLFLQHQPKLA